MKRKQSLEHDFAVAGWALSILLEIRDDVKLNLELPIQRRYCIPKCYGWNINAQCDVPGVAKD